MWESFAIRQLGVLESVGSNPTILTAIVVWRNGSVPGCYPEGEGSIPSTTAGNGRASPSVTAPAWNADEAQALAGSTPVPSAFVRRLCSWESSWSPKPTEWVRILPTLLEQWLVASG